jgi:serine/threonine protein kinase
MIFLAPLGYLSFLALTRRFVTAPLDNLNTDPRPNSDLPDALGPDSGLHLNPTPNSAKIQIPPKPPNTPVSNSRPTFLLPSENPNEMGRLGGYGILSILGKGGMGMVLLAHDKMLDRKVAVKVMLPEVATPDNRDRFFREARSTAALNHDHIVPIFQVGEENSVPYLVMPFLQGEALDRRLARERVPPLGETLRIIRETATGLMAAQEKGMIHRDIKPGNIWLEGPQGRVRILDFGLAKTRSSDANITQAGAIMGTPAYMAPEQAAGRDVDSRADIFSLGVIFYEMLTGVRPFQGNDTLAILTSLLTTTPVNPGELDPSIPKNVCRLVMAMIAKEPIKRPRSARDVAQFISQLENNSAKNGASGPPSQTKISGQRPVAAPNNPSPPTPALDERIFDTKMILDAIPPELLALSPGGDGSPPPAEPPVLSLELLAGGGPPNQVRGEKIQVGRASGSKLRIQSSQVSRTHAQIVWVPTNPAHYTIEDLESTNGTFINGCQIKKATPLLPGDKLNFGTLGFQISYEMPKALLETLIKGRTKSGIPVTPILTKETQAPDSSTFGVIVENHFTAAHPEASPPTRNSAKKPNKGNTP